MHMAMVLESVPKIDLNRHAHTEYLKLIEVYSPLGIWHFFYTVLTPISTTSGL